MKEVLPEEMDKKSWNLGLAKKTYLRKHHNLELLGKSEWTLKRGPS
jgi:hypothetical protein